MSASENEILDYVVIGSGFGGSVAAMRLAEKGYSVKVIEKGKWYRDADYPKTNWNIPKYLWMPLVKCFGFQKLTFFKDVFILSGVGVGGGSLVYANTHFFPPDAFFENPVWAGIKDWKQTLLPFYRKAEFMLGTTKYPHFYEEDRLLKEVATDMNMAQSFDQVNVGVYFGDTEKPTDPYFSGLGPQRTGCQECAGCMVGCRHGAKNTLDKNYLYFAQQFGAQVMAETLATKVEFINGEYHIHTERSTSWFNKRKKVVKAKGIVFAGGVLGTMDLLLKQKHETKTLPQLSDTLGFNLRTNSESLCGVVCGDRKLNNGIAITSVFNPDENTHIEVVKFPDHSGAMTRLGTLATGEGKPFVRTVKMIGNLITKPVQLAKMLFSRNLPKNSIIFLVMQTLDSKMKMVWKRGWFGGKMDIDNSGNAKVPAFIPIGQEVMTRYAEKIKGIPMNAVTEIMFNMSTTAHILGGCPMGDSAENSVVDEYFRVHNYPNMMVLDGSIIPCNIGVNPSLSITALSEYAMHHVPQKVGNTQPNLDALLYQAAKNSSQSVEVQ